jgi:hypothetical protein
MKKQSIEIDSLFWSSMVEERSEGRVWYRFLNFIRVSKEKMKQIDLTCLKCKQQIIIQLLIHLK